ncbi:CubicO group peptidase, beta-lactamase class C family [Mucilaginibacter pineti]|uniref:CubicO group peptidase, beta-lactamase class C family n=1 Tax=Mucilaginibacter pineti TaxID=1391627 RepID=A0A1G7NMY7_9SPHI|nr:serine hydrolase domain-containing protein [Mucilaginibacter pineti]SDF75428.1 CubicO group peptidase, beta-lactamase class C family [Mucilaginibacter pineti]
MKLLTCLMLSSLLFIQNPVTAQLKTIDGKPVSIAKTDLLLRHQMHSLHIPGLSIAVINDGKIAYQRQWGFENLETKKTVDEQTLFEAASMSKTVFAYFVLKMADKRLINLDTPLYKYLPNPAISYDERYKRITARMVLSHTTGMPNWREYDLADSALHMKKGELYLKLTPGTHFSYSGEAYQYLVEVMAKLIRTDLKNLGQIVYQEVCVPLGMTHAYFNWNRYVALHRATGYRQENNSGINEPKAIKKFEEFSAAGGLRTNAADYARFLITLISGKGLSKYAIQEMLKAQSLTDPDMVEDNGAHWGLGIAMKDTPYGIRYQHSSNNGDFTAYFVLYTDKKSGFVFLTNCNKAGDLFEKLEPWLTTGNY